MGAGPELRADLTRRAPGWRRPDGPPARTGSHPHRSSVTILGSLLASSLTYLPIGVAVALRNGNLAGALAAVAAPVCGAVTIWTFEFLRAGRAIKGSRFTRTQGHLVRSVRANRAAVVDAALSVLAGSTGVAPNGRCGVAPLTTPPTPGTMEDVDRRTPISEFLLT